MSVVTEDAILSSASSSASTLMSSPSTGQAAPTSYYATSTGTGASAEGGALMDPLSASTVLQAQLLDAFAEDAAWADVLAVLDRDMSRGLSVEGGGDTLGFGGSGGALTSASSSTASLQLQRQQHSIEQHLLRIRYIAHRQFEAKYIVKTIQKRLEEAARLAATT